MANKILVSLPEKFLEEVDRVAAEEHRSRSELIREALRTYFEAKKKQSRRTIRELCGQETQSKTKKPFPNIEVVKFTGGTSAVIRGTRIK